eukprot:scaffold12117_cov76-Skeletonema_marinoi.AAC.2
MSDRNEADTSCCASCGIAGGDDIKLKKCNGCYLVKYCSLKCQKDIDRNTNEHAKNEWLNYAMNYYSSSLKVLILGTAPSA